MLILRQQLRQRHHRRGKQRSQTNAQQPCHHGRNDLLWNEPEQQLQAHRDRHIRGDGMLLRPEDARCYEAQHDATDRDAAPEACCCCAGGVGRCSSDAQHECHDPAADADFDTDVDEEEDRASVVSVS
jgi:hypothetical protein